MLKTPSQKLSPATECRITQIHTNSIHRAIEDRSLLNKRAEPTDKFVGQNIRLVRKAKGLSQTQLGDAIGVTFQQVQKYENGFNRVGSSRLVRIATALDVPVHSFFHGIVSEKNRPTPTQSVGDLLGAPDAMDMLKALATIPNPKVRRSLVALVESIGAQKKLERRR